MKASVILLLCLSMFFAAGCASYSGAAKLGKNKVLILRNDGLLFGLLRKAVVCNYSSEGVSNCKEQEQP